MQATRLDLDGSWDEIGNHARDAASRVSSDALRTLERGGNFVRANPVPVMVGVVAVGCLAALLFSKRDLIARGGHLIDERRDDLGNLLRSAAQNAGKAAEEYYHTATTALESLLQRAEKS